MMISVGSWGVRTHKTLEVYTGLQPQYEFDTISHKKATWHNNQKHRWDEQDPVATVRGPVGGTSGYLVNNN